MSHPNHLDLCRNGEKDTNPLDLNNLPKDYGSKDDGKQTPLEGGSSSSGHGSRKKKKDVESGKLYECRFCSLRFYKSQALGGHMNRHRQERETETLNKARMLVFSYENNMPTVHGLPAHQLGGQMAGPNGGFHQHGITDPALHFIPSYPVQAVSVRLPANSQSSLILQNQQNLPQPYLYSYPPSPHFSTYPESLYKASNDYCVGNNALGTTGPHITNYTCIGASPAGQVTSLNSTNGVRENETLLVHASKSSKMRGLQEPITHMQLQPATRLDPLHHRRG